MDAGIGVTPELLSSAAAAIDTAVRTGDVGTPPTPAGAVDYGHQATAEAVARFASAIQQATKELVSAADRAAAGLRDGADSYLAQERDAVVKLIGMGP